MEQALFSKQIIFAAPKKFSLEGLGELLSGRLEARIERCDAVRRIYLDTFDWRLYRSGMVLEIECQGALCLLVWRELNSGMVLFSRTVRKPPQNAGDFSSAGGQSMLKRILGRRSLIAHATLISDTEKLLLLNEDEKIIMRVELRRDQILPLHSTSHITMDDVIYLFPYRGYEDEFNDRLRWAVKDGGLSPVYRDPLLSALDALDITPGQYTSRPAFSFDNDQPSLEALVQILKRFLRIMDSNIAGAREDDDPEYLHDFLVAVRRTSTFLSRFASIFPANNLSVIEHGFQWVEHEATPIRDLDIYMSLFDDFEARVDEDHRQALNSLYLFLQEQKKREIRRMRISLNSPRYVKLIESWSEFLQRCESTEQFPKDARAPIGRLARDRLRTIFRKFVKKSKGLSQDASVEEICELHQISKHLGYHLDVFSSLFPNKKINRLLKAHEGLQSSLNRFRDMTLQYSRLREYKSGMKKSQAVRKVSLEAVEQLITDRKSEKARARKEVIDRVERFTRSKMRKRFKSMLADPVEGGAV